MTLSFSQKIILSIAALFLITLAFSLFMHALSIAVTAVIIVAAVFFAFQFYRSD